jgi:hypothetical protein
LTERYGYRYSSEEIKKEFLNLSEEELELKYIESVKIFTKKYGKDFKNEEIYFVDKPLVDYLKIFSISDMFQYNYPELSEEEREEYKIKISF